ncbi:MAG: YmdB family metallophosphoesterase [Bacteriovoracia bacterium]
MKVLFFGDVFGSPGRRAVATVLPRLVAAHGIDFVVINGENAAHGRGITPQIADEFFALGADVITTGNHAWDQREIIPYIEREPRLLRPLNFPGTPENPSPGRGVAIVSSKKNPAFRLAVLHVIGRVHMEPADCPFRAADTEIAKLELEGIRNIFVDFHGDATSEKQAFAFHVDGRVAAVVGSHSHVQTADERVLANGTAAITDVGMCGCFDSVIGVKKEISIQKFVTKRPVKFEPAEGPGGYGAVVVDIDEQRGRARSILRLREVVVT